MGYVYGLAVLYGLLTWFVLSCEFREERERAAEEAREAEAVR